MRHKPFRANVKSIYINLFASFLVIALVLESTTLLLFSWGQRTVRNEIERSAVADVQFISSMLESELSGIVGIEHQLINDSALIRFATNHAQMVTSDYYLAVADIRKRLTSLVLGNAFIADVMMVIPAADCAITSSSFIRNIAQDESYTYLPDAALASHVTVRNHVWDMYMCYPSNSLLRGTVPVFFLRITLDTRELSRLLNRSYSNSHEFATLTHLASGTMLTSSTAPVGDMVELTAPFQGQVTMGGKEYFAVTELLANHGLLVERLVPMEDILSVPRRFSTGLICVTALLFIGLVLFSLYTYRAVRTPVQALVAAFRRLEQGDMETRIDGRFANEFAYLVSRFNETIVNLRTLIEQEYIVRLYSQRIELTHLQSQMNPHFLYNSLFMLRRLIQEEDMEAAQELAAHLGRYFQFIKRSERELIPMRDEAAHACEYLKIQQMRFEGRLQLQMDELPDAISTVRVPPLVLQPLIENALEHGLADKQRSGTLHVTYGVQQDAFTITVEDNGETLSAEMLDALSTRLEEEQPPAETSGMFNIHKRLRLRYGSDFGLAFDRSAYGGLRVTVRLPR